ncbi:hypothetical protein EO94_18580 [Methanosarcina sp. 2.H.T.1A.3]|nr:hypothetical protein EO94_18580 [Methanosarcina sp. 2.H.T.1A.3]KKG23451.1 hypothetical protein EO96_17545 [Methanosarcina sp. 2.H.T.1A.8]
MSETNKEVHQGFLVNILAAQHRCRNKQGSSQGFWPTFTPPSCNLRTGFKRVSETNKETAVSGQQSGYLPYQEADLEGTGGKRENGRFWQHSGNPLFFIAILFCSVFSSFY